MSGPGRHETRQRHPEKIRAKSPPQGVRGQHNRRILVAERGPWNPLQLITWRQSEETEVAVGDPEIPRGVLRQGAHESAGSRTGNKPVLRHIANPGHCGNPDSPPKVLKTDPNPSSGSPLSAISR